MSFCLALATVALSQQDEERTREFSQSRVVLARYGDVPINLDAPVLAPPRHTYTSQNEMILFFSRINERAQNVHVGSLGTFNKAGTSPFLLLTAEGVSEPQAVKALDRPIVWLIGLQHGNEPAAGEKANAGAFVGTSRRGNPASPLLGHRRHRSAPQS